MQSIINFQSMEEQKLFLNEMLLEWNITGRGLAEAMKIPFGTFRKFLEGTVMMRPVHCQLLGLYIILRDSQPDLFYQLIPESARDQRFNDKKPACKVYR